MPGTSATSSADPPTAAPPTAPPPPPRPWEPEGVGGVPLADKEGVACLREELIGCEAEWAIWPPPLCLDPGVPW